MTYSIVVNAAPPSLLSGANDCLSRIVALVRTVPLVVLLNICSEDVDPKTNIASCS